MTPLKQPITVTFDCVERAIVIAALCHVKDADECAFVDKINGFKSGRTLSLRDAYCHVYTETAVISQIDNQLRSQGIDWRTWQPPTPIKIGSYTVEFQKDAIKVGCKTVPHATVKAILERLKKPAVKVSGAASIDTHGDPLLHDIVQDLAMKHGYSRHRNERLDHEYSSICLFGGNHIGGNLKQRQTWISGNNALAIDARKDFGAVLDFFRQPVAPEIKIEGETVKFNGSDSIEVFGETVTTQTVEEICKRMEVA